MGQMGEEAILGFVTENETDYWVNRITLLTFVLLGDPALKMSVKAKTEDGKP